MTLQAELDTFKAAWTERVGPVVAQMMAEDNAGLLPQAAKARKAGDQFPSVTLTDQLGRPVDLAALTAQGPLVVTFYRGGWCPYCNLELRAYQSALPEIERLGARLIAVTPETPDNALTLEPLAVVFARTIALEYERGFGPVGLALGAAVGLGDVLDGAPADVLGLGLRPQELVLQAGDLGLGLGEARFEVRPGRGGVFRGGLGRLGGAIWGIRHGGFPLSPGGFSLVRQPLGGEGRKFKPPRPDGQLRDG